MSLLLMMHLQQHVRKKRNLVLWQVHLNLLTMAKNTQLHQQQMLLLKVHQLKKKRKKVSMIQLQINNCLLGLLITNLVKLNKMHLMLQQIVVMLIQQITMQALTVYAINKMHMLKVDLILLLVLVQVCQQMTWSKLKSMVVVYRLLLTKVVQKNQTVF